MRVECAADGGRTRQVLSRTAVGIAVPFNMQASLVRCANGARTKRWHLCTLADGPARGVGAGVAQGGSTLSRLRRVVPPSAISCTLAGPQLASDGSRGSSGARTSFQRYPSPNEEAAGADRSNVTMEFDHCGSEAGRAGSTSGARARGLAVPRGHGGTARAVRRPVGEGCGRRVRVRCGDVTYWSKTRPQRRARVAGAARAGPEGSVIERNLRWS